MTQNISQRTDGKYKWIENMEARLKKASRYKIRLLYCIVLKITTHKMSDIDGVAWTFTT